MVLSLRVVLLLPLGLEAVTTDQQQGRPIGILFGEFGGEMLKSCSIGDVVPGGNLVNGVGNVILHHRWW